MHFCIQLGNAVFQCRDVIFDGFVFFFFFISKFQFLLFRSALCRFFFLNSFLFFRFTLRCPVTVSSNVVADIAVFFERKGSDSQSVQEVTVVGYDDYSSREIIQIVFQYCKCVDIQVICRFVKDQYIRCLHQDAQQIKSSLFTARQCTDFHAVHVWREQESFQHLTCRHISVLRLDVAGDFLDIFNDSLVFIQCFVFLGKVADFNSLAFFNDAGIRFNLTHDHFQKC